MATMGEWLKLKDAIEDLGWTMLSGGITDEEIGKDNPKEYKLLIRKVEK
jgi:hypothetical protein